ncbi:MAG: DPP IV N-terminal domain-containing protein, partial [Planctomycetota bacterium]|nr:DPP IV N-terminal domain-containing protein [Planctomycetota bacterium]
MSIVRWVARFAILLTLSHVGSAATFGQNRPSPRVYKSSIEPHWFDAGKWFWYRNDLPAETREFVVVDTQTGVRRPAFDHSRVAASLGELLKQPLSADKLPVESIEFLDDHSAVTLRGRGAAWKLTLADYTISQAPPTPPESLPTDLPIRASRRTGAETEIVFVNELDQPVEIFWLEPGGARRSYGKIEPKQERAQHTFAGHRWLVTGPEDMPVAVVQATDQRGLALIDGKRPPREERRGTRPARRDAQPTPDGVPSPDGKLVAFVRDHNLFVRERDTGVERPMSRDGSPTDSYHRDAVRARAVEMDYETPDWPESLPEVYWSPDSARLLAIRTRAVPEPRVHLIESAPRDGSQPKLHSYPYIKPGDPIPLRQPRLFDVSAGKGIALADDLFNSPWNIDDVRWDRDSARLTFVYNARGHQTLRILAIDASTGAVRAIVYETTPTFINYAGKFYVNYLDATRELVWMSERDGWNHLYLFDSHTGVVKNQITRGEWVVRGVDRVDTETRQIWFRASGVFPDQDPYYVHWGRVNLDGTGLTWLTEGDGTHGVQWSPNRDFLIDTWSRVDLPPIHELRRASDGTRVCDLETADSSEFTLAGVRFPTRFATKGRDGTTDIFGIVHWPRDFAPGGSYPVVELIYAGPHSSHVPKAFQPYWGARELADRGFCVVQIDGMGTGDRSKAFHDVCWKNLADAGFPDRILWMRELAKRHPELDLTRVGIYGGSAGGQNALGALLWHGDFYKAAVADCGCHDNRMDKIWWNEQWMGWPLGPHYVEQSNVTQAHRLQGKLLLVVGELDRNVDPASTLQVVDALVR